MSPFAQLVKLAGTMPAWRAPSLDEQTAEMKRKKRNAYMRVWQRAYRRRKAKK